MRRATRSVISTFASLAVVVALAGCSGSTWQFWKTSSAETPTEPVVATAPPEPTAATATPAPGPTPTAHPVSTTHTTAAPASSANGYTDVLELADVHFRSGQVTVARGDHKVLDGVAGWLKAHPTAVVTIEGHTDDLGTREGNLAAGQKRAASVKSHLVTKGIAAGRITITSVGSDRPLCVEKTDACRARNRRAHFVVKQP
jgi:peptidoglycan-associated lipoprotein